MKTENLTFSEVLVFLKEGYCVSREKWRQDRCVLVMQIPAVIPKEVVPKMTSLPNGIKDAIKENNIDGISYHDQVLKLVFNNQEAVSATYYPPSWEDIFAEDWFVLECNKQV